MNLPRTATLLALLAAAHAACGIPDKLCIGDCPDATGADAGDSLTEMGSTLVPMDDESTGEPPDTHGDVSTTTPMTGAEETSAGEPLTCDLQPNFDPLGGCGDGVPNPGELCFIEGFGTSFPQGVVSTVPVRIADSTDLLVAHKDRTVTAVQDGPDPDLDLTQQTWPFDFPPGKLVLTGAGDLDGDGSVDAVGRNKSAMGDGDTVEVIRIAADGSLLGETNFDVGTISQGPVVVDWNADSHLDLVVLVEPGADQQNVILLAGDGLGGFVPGPIHGFTQTSGLFAVGSLDADGVANDLVLGGFDGALDFFVFDPEGPDAPDGVGFDHNIGPDVLLRGLEVSDLNGDGLGDVVVLHDDLVSDTSVVTVLLQDPGTPEPTFAASRHGVLCGATALALGDLDGDGAVDIVTAGVTENLATIRRNDGAGGFDQVTVVNLPALASELHVADFTGNGAADIVTVDWTMGVVAYLANSP